MRFLLRLLWIIPCLTPVLHAANRIALGDNEELTYHVAWGSLLPAVGEIKISAHATADATGMPLLRIVTTTATRSLAHLILPFEARAESLFDPANGRLLWLEESVQRRNRSSSHSVRFDYAKGAAEYLPSPGTQGERTLVLPPGYPTDLITCLVQARSWNLRPGEKHDALVLFEDDFYQLTIHAIGYEQVTTPMGTYDTLVLEPRMEKTPPKGMFKRGSTVRVWISQDEERLPVRFQVEFKFGAGVATLVDYRPPTPKVVAAR